MIQVDLITGFLGAGKTTFLRRYADYLMSQGLSIGIIENDYGAVNVDMMLLQDLMGEHCELEMIAGACCEDCHRRRLKTKLIAMGMCGYDRVIIEPSGIYDVDEFFDVLREEPLDRWYEIGSVIAVVDARLEEELSEEAEFLLASEVANAGCLLVSKVQDCTPMELEGALLHIRRALDRVQCHRDIRPAVLAKDWSDLNEADFARIRTCGYATESYRKLRFTDAGFSCLPLLNPGLLEAQLRMAVPDLFADPACGRIFRIKGFFRGKDGSYRELNATKNSMTIEPIAAGQDVLIVIGEELNEEGIRNKLYI